MHLSSRRDSSHGRFRTARLAMAAWALATAMPASAAPVPTLAAENLNDQVLTLPADLPAPRTLVLLAFRHEDQAVLQGWKAGLKLAPSANDWLEVPVVDVSNGMIKAMIRTGMKHNYPDAVGRSHVAPLFGNAATHARAFGVSGRTVAVLVLDRQGRVLASASGAYAPDSARMVVAAWHGAPG